MLASTLVVMALPAESQGRLESLTSELLYTGVGKVNAALHLTAELARRQAENRLPARVLNLGSAGSHQFELLQLVNCTQFFQHDMNATALGFAPGQTPFEPQIHLEQGLIFPELPQACLHSGDHFVTDTAANRPVIDMEGYALAKVCQHFQVTFGCVKFISDNANHQSSMSWPARLDAGSQRLAHFFKDFLKKS